VYAESVATAVSVPAHLHRSLAAALVRLSPYPRACPQPRTCFGTLLRGPRPHSGGTTSGTRYRGHAHFTQGTQYSRSTNAALRHYHGTTPPAV
jgi:hypothetical protein